MTIVINHTRKSGSMPETLTYVKSYRDTSVWSVEVTFNDGKIESFYAVESVKELSEPDDVIYELSLSYHFINNYSAKWDNKYIAYSKSIDKLKQKAIDTNKNIYNQQWVQKDGFIELNLNDECYSDSYIIKQINLI